jgi:hypothetical protein
LGGKCTEGPKFNMGLKLENFSTIGQAVNKTRGNPGPGGYNADYTKAKKRMASYSMKARHPHLKGDDVPGPGQYTNPNDGNSPDRKRGATVKIGTGARTSDNRTLAPGPGTYHIPCEVANMPGHTNARSKIHPYI